MENPTPTAFFLNNSCCIEVSQNIINYNYALQGCPLVCLLVYHPVFLSKLAQNWFCKFSFWADQGFKPNHFVPLMDIESCHPHTGFSRTAKKMSSTKIEIDGKKDHPWEVHDLWSDGGVPLRTVKWFQLQTLQNIIKYVLLASLRYFL